MRLDLPQIASNLSAETGYQWTAAEVEEWLGEAGITRDSREVRAWLVPEKDLGHFREEEVIEVLRIDSASDSGGGA